MTNTEPLDLDAIEARADAAHPGPWKTVATDRPPYDTHRNVLGPDNIDVGGGNWGGEGGGYYMNPGDAEFIAHAREDVPALIAEVRRLREQWARVWKSDDFDIVNGWLVERGVHPLDYPVEGYGAMPYSDAAPVLDLKTIAGWPQQPEEETR